MGEYEPEDSRNITGTASTPDGRWTNKEGKPPSGVPDDKPADAQDAAASRKLAEPGARPPISDEPNVPDRDALPGRGVRRRGTDRMATQPQPPPPDTVEPQAPPEHPDSPPPAETPCPEPPAIDPPRPDVDFPDRTVPETPPPPD